MLNKLGTTENMVIYHENGNKSYEFKTNSDGFIQEATRDKNGYPLTYKNSDGSTSLFTRDEQGKKLAYKDSNGYYEIKRKKVTQQEYEAFIQSLGKPKTVVQELLENLNNRLSLIQSEPNGIVRDTMINNFLIDTDHSLEKEKQQTLQGVYEGQKNHSASDEENKIMAKHWYQETFKQNK